MASGPAYLGRGAQAELEMIDRRYQSGLSPAIVARQLAIAGAAPDGDPLTAGPARGRFTV